MLRAKGKVCASILWLFQKLDNVLTLLNELLVFYCLQGHQFHNPLALLVGRELPSHRLFDNRLRDFFVVWCNL